MDKVKGIAKGGWDKRPIHRDSIHRDSWKSDVKGMATGTKKDPYESQRNHTSAPLTSLKDPDSFGPPPKHGAYYGDGAASPSRTTGPAGGLGSPVPAARPRQQEQVEDEPPRPPERYRQDTSGLRTDNLPKPPVRRTAGGTASPVRTASPVLPPRQQTPTLPPRQNGKPPPSLPPRMNEYPDESTPPPPPTYGEATQAPGPETGMLNQGAVNRLAQAGVSVPGFGIGSQQSASPRPQSPAKPSAPQLSELQQRFSRMNTGAESHVAPSHTPAMASPAAHKKPPPPPPPPKKNSLNSVMRPGNSDSASAPPPLPLSSKPRPTG